MLHDMKITGVLKKMDKSTFDFWGIGSRFTCRTTGDFDFFVEDSSDVICFLKMIGFHVIDGGYTDLLTNTVMEHPVGIHVQLTVNTELKKEVRDFLVVSGLEYHTSKIQRRAMWNMVIKGLKAQK